MERKSCSQSGEGVGAKASEEADPTLGGRSFPGVPLSQGPAFPVFCSP
ncbi:hypothetical protein LEMLEM_LOCUS1916, partial [Lemmus lemmus]